MPLTTAERNTVADAEAARLSYVSLHTADPGSSGTSEATGGSPAYARKALSFGADASGTASATAVTFDVPAGTYTHFGTWSASPAGTFRGGAALTGGSVTFGGQGQLQVTVTLPVT